MIYKSIAALLLTFNVVLAVENAHFVETFSEDPFKTGKWVKSGNEKYKDQPIQVKGANTPAPGFESDNGVQLVQEMKYYGFASKFQEPFVPNGNLVVQYEVKLEEGLNCGGAYIKLPRATNSLKVEDLNNETPYSIMFGPDKCGTNNKIHFILQHQNPVSLKWEEKHFNETIPIKSDKKTHLYTLQIKEDNSFEIFVDAKSASKGNLLTHMTPPINPPAIIDDPTDIKPSDWVDIAEIDDPNAVKPDDWDESQPKKIPDPNAVKPDTWDESAPKEIPDPEAVKPEDWDDDEDGIWEAPLISNPICDKYGCGPYTPPTINNPLYKGKWYPPKIPNPEYKGPWKAKQINNPDYFEDYEPAKHIAPIGAIAVEVWTTNAAIFFDNFIIAHDIKPVFQFADETFKPKAIAENKVEQEQIKAQKLAQAEQNGIRGKIEMYMLEAVQFLTENPWALVVSVAAIIIPFFYIILFGGKKAAQEYNNSNNGSGDNTGDSNDNGSNEEKKEGEDNKDAGSKKDD